jgi:Phage tail tube protein
MTLQTDASLTIKKETTYGTRIVTDRSLEFVDQSLTQDNKYVQGQGLRNGKYVARAGRRALAQVDVKGDIKLEATTKGLGPIFQAMLGTATSTVTATSPAYQQLYTPAITDPMPSYTIQVGMPPIGGGAILPQSFEGCVCDKWQITADASSGIVQLSTSWVGQQLTTTAPTDTLAYAATPHLFSFAQGSVSIGVAGTGVLTVPSTTVLGSMATPQAAADVQITKFELDGDNATDGGGFTFGTLAAPSLGQRQRSPVYGLRAITGSMTFEFASAVVRDWYLNQTNLSLLVTFTSDEVITGTTHAALQVAIPSLILEGDVPNSNQGNVVTTDVKFTVLDNEVAAFPLYIAIVTADVAL